MLTAPRVLGTGCVIVRRSPCLRRLGATCKSQDLCKGHGPGLIVIGQLLKLDEIKGERWGFDRQAGETVVQIEGFGRG
jgi:hypothetical protein